MDNATQSDMVDPSILDQDEKDRLLAIGSSALRALALEAGMDLSTLNVTANGATITFDLLARVMMVASGYEEELVEDNQ